MQITGTTTITSFGTSVSGLVRECRFAAALVITNSSAIVLPGSVNITTAAGDIITFRSLGSGNWAYVSGTKGAFLPLTGGAVAGATSFNPRPTFNGATPWDSANFNPASYVPLAGGAMTGALSISTTSTNLLELLGGGSYAGQFFTRGAVRWLVGAADITSPPAGITAGSYFIYEWPNSVQRLSIAPNGGPITMGTNVNVTGAFSAVTVTATSDERLKDVIRRHEPRDLTAIDIVEFTWKESGTYAISPLAQRVQKLAPEYVVELDNDFKTLTVDKAGLALERVAYLEGVLRKAGLL